MSSPLVSVVMVVCNVERFLEESIESILTQTFSDFEFIIVDFGSTDSSKAIASSFAAKDTRIRLHAIPHCGLAEARNAGCFLAQGRYIAIMDADDVSVPNRFLWETEFMERHPEVGVVGGATEWIDATGRSLRRDYPPTEDQAIRAELVTRCPFWQPSVLIRADAFALVGGYRTVFTQAEDYDLWLRMAEHVRCANLNQVVLRYRIHPCQESMRKRAQQPLCILAAQVSASLRKSGEPDPFDSLKEITQEALAAAGVTQAVLQNESASEWRQWIRHMCMAGEYAFAIKSATDLLQSDTKLVERWQIANLHLTIARIYWRQGQLFKSFAAVYNAVIIRPVVVGRPLKALLRRLGLT